MQRLVPHDIHWLPTIQRRLQIPYVYNVFKMQVLKEVRWVDCGVFLIRFCCFYIAICNWDGMIKELVSNIGIFAQKSNVFNGPLPLQGPRPISTLFDHIRGAVVLIAVGHRWKFPDWFVYKMTYEKQSPPNVLNQIVTIVPSPWKPINILDRLSNYYRLSIRHKIYIMWYNVAFSLLGNITLGSFQIGQDFRRLHTFKGRGNPAIYLTLI